MLLASPGSAEATAVGVLVGLGAGLFVLGGGRHVDLSRLEPGPLLGGGAGEPEG